MSIIAEALKKVARKRAVSQPEMPPEGISPEVATKLPDIQQSDIRSSAVLRRPRPRNSSPRRIGPLTIAVTLCAIAALAISSRRVTSTHLPSATSKAATEAVAKTVAVRAPLPEPRPMTQLPLLLKAEPSLVLNGIVWGHGEPIAIINNKVLWRGDLIKGSRVVEITPTRVALSDGTRDITLELNK